MKNRNAEHMLCKCIEWLEKQKEAQKCFYYVESDTLLKANHN